jgi:hypothetical protein
MHLDNYHQNIDLEYSESNRLIITTISSVRVPTRYDVLITTPIVLPDRDAGVDSAALQYAAMWRGSCFSATKCQHTRRRAEVYSFDPLFVVYILKKRVGRGVD